MWFLFSLPAPDGPVNLRGQHDRSCVGKLDWCREFNYTVKTNFEMMYDGDPSEKEKPCRHGSSNLDVFFLFEFIFILWDSGDALYFFEANKLFINNTQTFRMLRNRIKNLIFQQKRKTYFNFITDRNTLRTCWWNRWVAKVQFSQHISVTEKAAFLVEIYMLMIPPMLCCTQLHSRLHTICQIYIVPWPKSLGTVIEDREDDEDSSKLDAFFCCEKKIGNVEIYARALWRRNLLLNGKLVIYFYSLVLSCYVFH